MEEWTDNTFYKVNEIINFKNKTYICLQAHISNNSWNPEYTNLILWTEIKPVDNIVNEINTVNNTVKLKDINISGNFKNLNGIIKTTDTDYNFNLKIN